MSNAKKCSDSKPAQQCSSSGVGRRDPDAGTVQQLPTTSTGDRKTADIVNSRHVCGGKGSICEFLRSQPSQSSSHKVDGTTNASRSPGATATATATTATTLWNVAREVINSKAKDAGGVSEPLRSKPAPAPSCGGVAGPVTVEHVAIVINIPANKRRPVSESCGQPEERETGCECAEPSRGARRAGNRMVCECSSAMAEPCVQTMGRPQPPRDQDANTSCPRRRRHSNASSVVSQKAVASPGAKSIHHDVCKRPGPPPPPPIGAHQSNRNASACECRCHLH